MYEHIQKVTTIFHIPITVSPTTRSITFRYLAHSNSPSSPSSSKNEASWPFPTQNLIFSGFMNLWTFGRTPWKGDQPNARPLLIQDNTEKRGQACMRVRFEHAIPVFERSKIVRVLDSAATGTGPTIIKNSNSRSW
jgi:hypothetical protein